MCLLLFIDPLVDVGDDQLALAVQAGAVGASITQGLAQCLRLWGQREGERERGRKVRERRLRRVVLHTLGAEKPGIPLWSIYRFSDVLSVGLQSAPVNTITSAEIH